MSEPSRDRRAALLRLGALCGLALAGDVLAAVTAAKRPGAQPQFLTADELALTGVLAELIIPQTDTPGALAVGAHYTADHLLHACVAEPEQAATRAVLAKLDSAAQRDGSKRFVALPAARQVALLHALDNGTAPFDGSDGRAFRQLKSLVAFAYYTSEAGASQELAYLPFPGGFTGNVRITPSTRTWAL
ncbi:gluconate 2-dehydrogenase subunit 3-like protein [Pseudoduganella flava]|uniref:Gluconate 2-dehydrogenase subunit 3 family protein n=1 Tax=Pseudoduganella flava TaxID=871742 RepID=A0A562Q140_9BURK|nr:gluconate 2-dehydrogenase subunit 3 family protein [Pseudoduganella flava]QGZ38109.1 gluconate 2-dehydrogenase subunit 3 family protein [Pseudoduganella flava]TWI50377.1 gluconate 2-dehydrogenase subunit 3-like protein [Pseudoduganella flava]